MIPRQYQIEMAAEGFAVLKKYGLVYIAAEERTGKTLSAILLAEKCTTISKILVLTKKAAISGWTETLEVYKTKKDFFVTNYEQTAKLAAVYDLVILDEAHSKIASIPKVSMTWRNVKKLTAGNPIIYLSATPYAEGYQMLYHQLMLSDWCCWAEYKNFYHWFKVYGVAKTVRTAYGLKPVYTATQEQKIWGDVKHLFIKKTRKELGFPYEPEDELHRITLRDTTKALYNKALKNKVLTVESKTIPLDTVAKLRHSLYMLEGGVACETVSTLNSKNQPVKKLIYYSLDNQEKIDYIMKTWGDDKDLAIFYYYKEEQLKLLKHFKNARILHSTTHAEGVDLSDIKTIVVYSMDYSTSKHIQRRARQATQTRSEEITVHYLLVEKAVSEQLYNSVVRKKQNFTDRLFKKQTLR